MSATADQRRQALGYWEANAAPWDTTIGPGGNNYWKRLQKPCLERLLADHFQAKDRPHRALELACGNGLCSRWLASHSDAVGEVLATDGSRAMLDRARSHGSMDGKISFRELDVTNVDDFTRLLEEGAGVRPLVHRRCARLKTDPDTKGGFRHYHHEHGPHGCVRP